MPAMVALVTRGHDGKPLAIHRTYLARDGIGKAPVAPQKMMLGPCRGGAVRLGQPDDVLMVGEGIETAVSIAMLPECFGVPVWACLSACNLAAFPILAGVEVLWIAVDNDPSGEGECAAKAVVDRWTDAGREVFTIVPNALKTDINDIVRSAING